MIQTLTERKAGKSPMLLDKNYLEMLEIFGFGGRDNQGGYLSEGDIQYKTTDGVPYDELWAMFTGSLDYYNQKKSALVQLLTYPVQAQIEKVPRIGELVFEKASEFGVPKSARTELQFYQLSYDFDDYDLAMRYTWRFLRDGSANSVKALHNEALKADRKLMFRKVMEAIFDNRTRTTEIEGLTYDVKPLYNNDGTVPPSFNGKTFSGSHDHYLVSGGTKVDSEDIEIAINHIQEHGYTEEAGTTIVILAPKSVVQEIMKFERGKQNNNSKEALYDFVPSPNQPPLFVSNAEGLLGERPPSNWNGLRVQGSYANALIIENPLIPDNYFLTLASGGLLATTNLVGLREHQDPAWRGLRLLPGNQQQYPLIDGFYQRSFGTGIRQRGGAVVTQVKGSGSYEIPSVFLNGGGFE